MNYMIEYDQSRRAQDADAVDYRFRVLTEDGKESLGLRMIRVAGIIHQVLKPKNVLEDVVVAFAIQRFQALGADLMEDEYQFTDADQESLEEFAAREKSCEFQRWDKRDLHCEATLRLPIPDGVGKYRRSAILKQTCIDCDLPDERTRCSHLSHIEKVLPLPFPPQISPTIALCARGHLQKIEKDGAKLCSGGPSGHECWQRAIVTDDNLAVIQTPAWALAEAIDHLGAAWRLLFQSKLIQMGELGPVALLSEDAPTKAEFESRLSSLADVAKRFQIADSLRDPKGDKDHTLRHLEFALRSRFPEEAATISQAVGVLRAANGLRNAAQHSGAARKAPQLAGHLGLRQWPPTSYGAAWRTTRSATTHAFRRLRAIVASGIE